ncbi:oxidoreductase [Penicillium brasilianum]|uniref:Oxidoreductase n=1 Tax=Penicillium brasilianum TaxID=104259 RepID=A0A1S9RW48_PENBI|nr:oxidoreductase [Penicillium brasilianum]
MAYSKQSRIQLLKTAFVVYNHENLDKAKAFFLDFGFDVAFEKPGEEIYFKGYGSEPYIYVARKAKTSSFGGAGYVVDSLADFEKALKVPGASAVIQLEPNAGGGQQITLTDPFGHKVHLIWGWQEKRPEAMKLEKLVVNYEDEKPRKGRFQRFRPGPAPVHRWGHYGVTYPEGQYQTIYDWYTQTLSLAVSDIVFKGDKPTTCFLHIDRGVEYTDHHAFFFKKAKPGESLNVAHAAFEVHDFDIQQLGHNYLTSKGHKICWGVGRHVLGSQVFDYWFDPSRFVVEHYADGDLVNQNTPIAKVQAGPQALSIWGPPVPEVF